MSKQLWVKSYHTAISEIWTFKDHEHAKEAKLLLEKDDWEVDEHDEVMWEILENMIVNTDVINSTLNEQDNYDIINPNCFVYYF